MRNRYPLVYISSYYDFTQRYVEDGGVTFSRAGYTGIQKTPLVWAGDERSTFEAFRASIRAGLSSGMSGIPFWGWDLAGFHGDIPSAELFIRAAQMAAFCPVMQYHAETKGQFNQDRTPWNIAQRTGERSAIDIYRKYADIRMNLLPYIYHQAMITARTGIPLMRSMFLERPEEKCCILMDDQYFFGENLLVAPITREGQSSRYVYLPSGSWLDFFNFKRYEGGRSLKMSVSMDEIPVFIRENSVIPLNLDAALEIGSHVGIDLKQYDHLCFILFATGVLEDTFLDDAGNRITFKAACHDGFMDIHVESELEKDIYLIIPGITKKRRVFKDQAPLQLAEGFEKTGPDCCIIRGDRLIIRTACNTEGKSFRIVL
jgi:alpha-glucosidase (family GH31 glycosyl hydrolase)